MSDKYGYHHPYYGYTPYPPPPPGYQQGQGPMQGQGPVKPTPLINYKDPAFVKGLLIGAAAAYVLSNENVQQAAFKTMAKTWATVRGGVEEMKERFQDAEAEVRAEKEQPHPQQD